MDFAEADRESRKILARHGLSDWGVIFEDDPRYLGVCRYAQRHITLQASMVARANRFGEIFGTVLHEVAHALTPGAGHGPVWVRKVRELIAYYTFGNS